MLVLTRKRAESIKIGNNIVIKVIQTSRGTVKLGIDAPADVRVLRGELAEFASIPENTSRRTNVKFESDHSSDPMSDEENYSHGQVAREIEVEDLMMCVGVREWHYE